MILAMSSSDMPLSQVTSRSTSSGSGRCRSSGRSMMSFIRPSTSTIIRSASSSSIVPAALSFLIVFRSWLSTERAASLVSMPTISSG